MESSYLIARLSIAAIPCLRQLRSERRWSQSDLAERIGVSRQTVNAIENDRYDPSLPLAFRISTRVERPIEQMFEFQNEDQRD